VPRDDKKRKSERRLLFSIGRLMAKVVYQFKITLKRIDPPIWRRILVPEKYNFWDLHVAIQDAMGWLDYHLHEFRIRRKHAHKVSKIGIPDEDRFEGDPIILAGWEIPISRFFAEIGTTAEYDYDFGDGWEHEVLFEGILLKDKKQTYPQCIGGERACPPEDCGGLWGYNHLLEVLADPEHDEYEQLVTWLDGRYEPDEFHPEDVKFDNPKKRWKIAFLEGP
jgi:hypothetical protein